MSARSGAKQLVRQISAIVIAFILWWILRVVFYDQLSGVVLVSKPHITLPDGLAVLLAVVIAGLVKGLRGPLESIYKESIPSKARTVTRSLLDLVTLAILYVALRSPVVEILKLYPQVASVANVIYDLAFIVVGLLILYGVIKVLTE